MATFHTRQAAVVAHLVARVLTGLGVAMLPAIAVGVVRGEPNAVAALAIGAAVSVGLGTAGRVWLRHRRRVTWSDAFVATAWVWLVASVVAAVPLHLSGHYGSFLDAVFEAMSGLTTTGLTLVQDLDHLSYAMNAWRHSLQILGGVGVLVAAHTLFARGNAEVGTLNVPERHDDRVLPDVRRTARFALRLVAAWAVVAVPLLWIASLVAGHGPVRAAAHAASLFASAFTTGGFALTSASVGLHHALGIEVLVIVLMLAGAVTLALHEQLWTRRRRGVHRDLQAVTFATSVALLLAVTFVGLTVAGTFASTEALVRRGGFTLVSAHTTSGLTVVPTRLVATDWGALAPAALVAAMTVGGLASSTAGGIKSLRIGLLAKGITTEVRRMLLPESALVVTTYEQRGRRQLTDGHVRAASTILLLFLASALGGAMLLQLLTPAVGLTDGLFTATAALSNTGLAIGVVDPAVGAAVKLLLLVLMWLGRLEFLAVLALVGSLVLSPWRRR